MSHISIILNKIQADYKDYSFKTGETFYWSPSKNTIFYKSAEKIQDIWRILHEIGHAELKHKSYKLDIQLVKYESAAWHYAQKIGQKYKIIIDDEFIEEHLDSYRNWLHRRSTCPQCEQNGMQTQNTYVCINCRCKWMANEARHKSLKRVKLPK